MKWLLRCLFVGCFSMAGTLAVAAPVGCLLGYADNACVQRVSHSAVAPPAGCTGAGQTVSAAPRWQGTYWSAPQCSYTPPPSCPPGTTQASSPSWNGSSWVGLVCTANPPQQQPSGSVQYVQGVGVCFNNSTSGGGCSGVGPSVSGLACWEVDETPMAYVLTAADGTVYAVRDSGVNLAAMSEPQAQQYVNTSLAQMAPVPEPEWATGRGYYVMGIADGNAIASGISSGYYNGSFNGNPPPLTGSPRAVFWNGPCNCDASN